jgi:nucleoside-diphosphate-sugar epimerase
MELRTTVELEDRLSDPPDYVIESLRACPGRVIILGAAGKMGPTLSRMVARALAKLGRGSDGVIAVSRFSNPAEREKLEQWGIQTLKGDLLDESFLASLPDASNVIYMAGMKFGATGNESLTWAMNTHLPAIVCRRYATSRIAAFSTGNVYGLCPVVRGGSVETDPPAPIGEYAMSCLGRERMFEYFSRDERGPGVSILRLNYACEPRYGVIADLASKLKRREPIDVTMGAFNAIWQADANAVAIASLAVASQPATVLNIAGPETLSVRRVCERLASILDVPCEFVGSESPDAILSNAQKSHRLFGYPRVGASELIDLIGTWVRDGGDMLNKPTHFETRDGKY